MRSLNGILTNWQRKKLLVGIFPHPDDETMAAGGLFKTAHDLGWQTMVVTLTHGEAGQNHSNNRQLALSQIRKLELEKASQILGIEKVILKSFPDSRLRKVEEPARKLIKKILFQYQPGIVVSYDHSGFSGHPDHILTSLVVKKVIQNHFSVKARPWLLWPTLPSRMRQKVGEPRIKNFASEPDMMLSLDWNWWYKWRAAKAHQSQKLGKNFPLPLGLILLWYRNEWYHKVDFKKVYQHRYVDFKI